MSRFLQISFVLLFMALGDMPVYALEMSSMTVAELPREGRDTLALIRKGGPFPYSKDASIFSNREHILPKQARGYYREYTVKTPGARDRGARRIICGGKQRSPCFYTGDHYATFKVLQE